MKSITIRELHLATGRWVRHAATKGGVVIFRLRQDSSRVAALLPVEPTVTGKALPNREAKIRGRSPIPVDSAIYVSEMRGRG